MKIFSFDLFVKYHTWVRKMFIKERLRTKQLIDEKIAEALSQ